MRALGFRGANVTIPHKAAVIPHLDWIERDAALAEAVNTIVVEADGALRGYNTDIPGFTRALEEVLGAPPLPPGAPALILGAGGAARAAALALARLGASLTVVNRTPEHARRLADLVASGVPSAKVAVRPSRGPRRGPRRRPAPPRQRHLSGHDGRSSSTPGFRR